MSLLREITLMKTLTTLITILFISLLSSPSLSETITLDNLILRNNLYYKKFYDVPFTREITGIKSGDEESGISIYL